MNQQQDDPADADPAPGGARRHPETQEGQVMEPAGSRPHGAGAPAGTEAQNPMGAGTPAGTTPEPEAWATLGEAARVLDVAERTLRHRAGSAGLECRQGTRGGRRAKLYRLGDLRATSPARPAPAKSAGTSPESAGTPDPAPAGAVNLPAVLDEVRAERDWLRIQLERAQHVQAMTVEAVEHRSIGPGGGGEARPARRAMPWVAVGLLGVLALGATWDASRRSGVQAQGAVLEAGEARGAALEQADARRSAEVEVERLRAELEQQRAAGVARAERVEALAIELEAAQAQARRAGLREVAARAPWPFSTILLGASEAE